MIGSILLQGIFALAPAYLYTLLMLSPYYGRNRNRNRLYIGILCGGFGLLALEHPIYAGGAEWSLQLTMLCLAFLLGGRAAGGTGMGILLAGSLALGWNSGPIELLQLALTAAPCYFVADRAYTQPVRKSVLDSFVLSVYCMGLQAAVHAYEGASQLGLWDASMLRMMGVTSLLSFVTMITIIWQISYMLQYHQLQQEAHRSEKLRLISELAASVAHEVRNPLQVTRGFLQLSLKGVEGKTRDYLTMAVQELDRAGEIITAYLEFAKPRVDQLERIDAGEVLEEVVQMMHSYAGTHGASLNSDIFGPLPMLGDSAKLKQILINLVKNAVEAVEEGGNVQVRADSLQGQVSIRITDNGEGMTEAQLAQLGFPFYTTKQKGTGLGVMVTKRLAEAMKGYVRYASSPGMGTEVAVVFPKLDEHKSA